MPSVAPFFIEDATIHSEITIVNALLSVVSGKLSIRNLNGDLIATRDLTFGPHEKKVLGMRALLNEALTPASIGSVVLDQDVRITGVGLLAQLSMSSYASATPAYLEEEFAMPEANGSHLLRSVVSESIQPPTVAITSLIDQPQTLTVTCLDKNSPAPIRHAVAPHATLLVEACTRSGSSTIEESLPDTSRLATPEPHSYGIESASTARSEDFVAFGLTRDKDRMEAVEFVDPATLHSSSTIYVGVPVGPSVLLPLANYLPCVSIANFTKTPQTVSVLYAYTQESGSQTPTGLHPLRELQVPPLSTQTVSLSDLPPGADLTNSFIFRSSGPSGAVQVRLYAEGSPSLRRVELLGKDEKSSRNGGNHPWSTANGDRSTLLIFNYTADKQTVEVQVSADVSTWNHVVTLEPYETKKISLNQLIAEGAPDLTHHHLLKSETAGEVVWFTNDPNKVTGRLLVTNSAKSLARSFSCYNTYGMCSQSYFDPENYAALTAGEDVILTGITANECVSNSPAVNACNSNQTAGLNQSFTTTWTMSANPPVSVKSSGQTSITVHGNSVGSFSVQPHISAGGCISTPPPGGGTVNVPTSMVS